VANAERHALWEYYERRANEYEATLTEGVEDRADEIRAEALAVTQVLGDLPSSTTIDVGAGTGLFTRELPGACIAIDQSESMLRRLRQSVGVAGLVRADAIDLPICSHSVDRVFAGHLYGHLDVEERVAFVREAFRVARELVVLDSGRPTGVRPAEWQERSLSDGSRFQSFKRHFRADELAAEVGGETLFGGQYFVLVKANRTYGAHGLADSADRQEDETDG